MQEGETLSVGKAYSTLITLSNRLIKYGVIIGVILGLIGAVFYYPIGRVFTKEPEVLKAIDEKKRLKEWKEGQELPSTKVFGMKWIRYDASS